MIKLISQIAINWVWITGPFWRFAGDLLYQALKAVVVWLLAVSAIFWIISVFTLLGPIGLLAEWEKGNISIWWFIWVYAIPCTLIATALLYGKWLEFKDAERKGKS